MVLEQWILEWIARVLFRRTKPMGKTAKNKEDDCTNNNREEAIETIHIQSSETNSEQSLHAKKSRWSTLYIPSSCPSSINLVFHGIPIQKCLKHCHATFLPSLCCILMFKITRICSLPSLRPWLCHMSFDPSSYCSEIVSNEGGNTPPADQTRWTSGASPLLNCLTDSERQR